MNYIGSYAVFFTSALVITCSLYGFYPAHPEDIVQPKNSQDCVTLYSKRSGAAIDERKKQSPLSDTQLQTYVQWLQEYVDALREYQDLANTLRATEDKFKLGAVEYIRGAIANYTACIDNSSDAKGCEKKYTEESRTAMENIRKITVLDGKAGEQYMAMVKSYFADMKKQSDINKRIRSIEKKLSLSDQGGLRAPLTDYMYCLNQLPGAGA